MYELFWALGASIVVSLIAFIGILTLFFSDDVLKKIILPLVGLSAGALIGGAFLHLIPEASREIGIEAASLYILVGLILVFLEKMFQMTEIVVLISCLSAPGKPDPLNHAVVIQPVG